MKKLFILLGTLWGWQSIAQTNSLSDCRDKIYKTSSHPDLNSILKQQDELHQCLLGKEFPSFSAKTMSNRFVTKKDLEGKVVLLNFWFIACAPCAAEMPLLEELSNSYDKKKFALISFTRDEIKAVEDFFKENKITIETVADAHDLIENSIKVSFGYPSNFFLNKKGQIVEVKMGGATDEAGLKRTKDEFKKIIESELNK